MRFLSWSEFNFCIKIITKSCTGKQLCGVYGFPRGGLCLAVALSHSMKIPFLNQLRPGCLAVDDVYETGNTLNKVLDIPDITTFVWFSKVTPDWWNTVHITTPEEWLVFPWENKDQIQQDKMAYKLARKDFDD